MWGTLIYTVCIELWPLIQEPYYSDSPLPMEYLTVNKGWGQGYGFVLYSTKISPSASRIAVYGLKDYGVVSRDWHYMFWFYDISQIISIIRLLIIIYV